MEENNKDIELSLLLPAPFIYVSIYLNHIIIIIIIFIAPDILSLSLIDFPLSPLPTYRSSESVNPALEDSPLTSPAKGYWIAGIPCAKILHSSRRRRARKRTTTERRALRMPACNERDAMRREHDVHLILIRYHSGRLEAHRKCSNSTIAKTTSPAPSSRVNPRAELVMLCRCLRSGPVPFRSVSRESVSLTTE